MRVVWAVAAGSVPVSWWPERRSGNSGRCYRRWGVRLEGWWRSGRAQTAARRGGSGGNHGSALLAHARAGERKKGEEESWRCEILLERGRETCGDGQTPATALRAAATATVELNQGSVSMTGKNSEFEPLFLPKLYCNISIDQYKS